MTGKLQRQGERGQGEGEGERRGEYIREKLDL